MSLRIKAWGSLRSELLPIKAEAKISGNQTFFKIHLFLNIFILCSYTMSGLVGYGSSDEEDEAPQQSVNVLRFC